VSLHPDLSEDDLPRGAEVVLNESLNVVLSRGREISGEVVQLKEILDLGGGKMNGFIAQDLYKAYPEAVVVGDEDVKKKAWSVDYGRITPLLVKAMQELKSLFDGDHAELVKLKAANDNQSAALKAANNNTAALRKEFEAYKTAHP
jgi:hypothetical protein